MDNEMFDEKTLLPKFKLSTGDLTPNSSDLDEYYKNFLSSAAAILRSNDISEAALKSELGKSSIIMHAKALMEGTDISSDPTCILLRNTLSVQTKGERYVDGE